MKFCSIFLLLYLFTASKSFATAQEVIITGKVYTGSATQIVYTIPHQGVFYWYFNATVKTDEQGNFQIKIPCKTTSSIFIGVHDRKKSLLVISPGEYFTAQFGADKNEDFFKIKGPNEAGQALFRAIPHPGLAQLAARKYLRDTSVTEIRRKIDQNKAKDLKPFEDLLKAQKISPAFFDLVKDDRDCYYAAIQALVVQSKVFETAPEKLSSFSSAFKNLADETFQKYPLESPGLIRSSWWPEYAETFRTISTYLAPLFDPKKLEPADENQTYHTHMMQDASNHFKGMYLEFFQAHYLCYTAAHKKYEKELVNLFEVFQKNYPQSPYTAHLKPLIDPVVDYHRVQDTSFTNDYKFLNNYIAINSLDSALKVFKGKKLYIDVWATWCSPCKAEFAHKEALKKLLAKHGFEILYVSMDDDKRDEAWKKMIKFYQLEGHHVRTNKFFDSDLRRIFGQGDQINIPWYLLVNQEGKIVVKDAERPSNLKALEEQLNSW